MLFNSFEFLVFFLIVYALYGRLGHRSQNRMLLAASCLFYGWWDWRFLLLMLATILIDYFVALALDRTREPGARKALLIVSVASNLGILGFFKYFNFFAENLAGLLTAFGISPDWRLLNIVLPVGISFYTFQALSYTVDVYRGILKPVRNIFDYALFVTFFPQLVAGPIERASHLIPQVLSPRVISRENFSRGCCLIAWGLFKKVFIADSLAGIVDPVFTAQGPYDGGQVLLAVYAFAFQIYCDFSGYSDMARGLGRLLGFEIMVNFNLPYFSASPSEFWRRWHISLSTWLRDYLYVPLGGNRKGTLLTYRNLALTMLLGGLWHGANWTFIVWGAYHGLLLIAQRLASPAGGWFSRWNSAAAGVKALKVVVFFHLVCLGWVFFRAQSVGQALEMLAALAGNFHPGSVSARAVLWFLYLILLLLAVDTAQFFSRKDSLEFVFRWPAGLRLAWALAMFYCVMYVEILSTSVNIGGGREFIYFQF